MRRHHAHTPTWPERSGHHPGGFRGLGDRRLDLGVCLGPQHDADSIAAIHRALELGVNRIDTAVVYGMGQSGAADL
jgi:predicted aldo/keto reductase-like oxidoreductase